MNMDIQWWELQTETLKHNCQDFYLWQEVSLYICLEVSWQSSAQRFQRCCFLATHLNCRFCRWTVITVHSSYYFRCVCEKTVFRYVVFAETNLTILSKHMLTHAERFAWVFRYLLLLPLKCSKGELTFVCGLLSIKKYTN